MEWNCQETKFIWRIFSRLNLLYLLDAMAIVIVELTVNNEQVVVAAVVVAAVALSSQVVELAVYVVLLVLLVPFGENSAKTTDHRCSLTMVARNHDDD